MQRYFIDNNKININNNIVIIDGSDHHHIKNVMRMRVGEKVIACTNDCNNYLCTIESISNYTTLKIIEHFINNNELPSYISIAQGLVKKNKCDEVLRRLVELGAREYFNVSMDYSVVKDASNEASYLERRDLIVKEASEQSERGLLLKNLNTMKFNDFLKYANDFDIKIVAYEESGRSGDTSLKTISNNLINKKIICLVGPEGGISEKEITKLKENGFVLIGLGKRILRTETAPLYLMSVLSYLIEG